MLSKRSCAEFVTLCLLTIGFASSCESRNGDSVHQLFAFGTRIELNIYGGEAVQVRDVTAHIEARYREVDRDWYPWDRASFSTLGELQRINTALASGQSIEVSPRLAQLIRRAAIVEQRSSGKFNAGIGRLTQLWGFDDVLRDNWAPPSAVAVQALIALAPGSDHLRWQNNALSSRSTVTQIDLGGIAKGAILDLTVALLREGGVENAIVNIGGDLSVLGNVHGRAARIGIRSPVAAEPIGWLDVADGETVVTSGDYERFFEYRGQRYQHILDPRNGFPVRHTASVTVIARDAVLADAAATALMVAGMDEFDQTCAALGIQQAILVDSSGELRLTADMNRRVNWLQ
ncbi:MAG: FAD:protein FMN transferase [Gammaproteobacteria bacterium]|nr:FAD:protein FMN transferase [Gammaproteobacteria bacterium]